MKNEEYVLTVEKHYAVDEPSEEWVNADREVPKWPLKDRQLYEMPTKEIKKSRKKKTK